MRALRDIGVFNAALMKDPAGVLEKQGPNTQYPDMIRFTETKQVKKLRRVIRAYLAGQGAMER